LFPRVAANISGHSETGTLHRAARDSFDTRFRDFIFIPYAVFVFVTEARDSRVPYSRETAALTAVSLDVAPIRVRRLDESRCVRKILFAMRALSRHGKVT
jgi:hypothetical protein